MYYQQFEVFLERVSGFCVRGEVPWGLFLGVCRGFSYSLLRVVLPQFGFHIDNVIPPASMDQLIFVRAVHVFSQGIVISVSYPPTIPVEAV
ncbi:hypothetical protein M3B96_05590, partial [Corynebacterium propinquum]|uniref:hypothetical protein n=2 Tax=Corynebacterium propinquum TaxID=43769 RepID=UPI00223B6A70